MEIPTQIRDAIIAHAHFCYPEEACGLLAADRTGELRMAYCLTNAEHSSSRFTVDPDEHFGALRHAERNGWEIAGVFHSHPHGEPIPSDADRAGSLDPDWIYVITGPACEPAPNIAFYQIEDGRLRTGPPGRGVLR